MFADNLIYYTLSASSAFKLALAMHIIGDGQYQMDNWVCQTQGQHKSECDQWIPVQANNDEENTRILSDLAVSTQS